MTFLFDSEQNKKYIGFIMSLLYQLQLNKLK